MPQSSWLYLAFFIVILSLLYIIRRYEKGRQELKLREEKSRSLKRESDFQKTRQDYLEILDSLPDGYVETDLEGIITHVNLPFLQELGFNNREEVVGKIFWHFIQKKFADDVADKFNILFGTGLPAGRFETRFYGKDGLRFIGEAALLPVFDQEKVVGSKATIRNNTQRFKAEKDLAVQKDFLDELLQQTPVAVVIIGTDHQISFVNATFEKLFGYVREEVIGKRLEDLLSSPEIEVDMKECMANYPTDKLFMSARRKTKEGGLTDVEVYAQRFFVGSQNYGKLIFYHDISLRVKAEEVLRMAKDVAERDLEMGREMQAGFFPQVLPEMPDWDMFAYFKAARQVSGDFYDVFPIGKKAYYGIVIADVCDKGVGAALFMVLLRSLIRSYSEQFQEEIRTEELVHHIAISVNAYIVNTHGRSNMFATLVLGILDPATNRLYYVNGGHDAPVLVDAKGQIKAKLDPGGPAFGFSTDLDFDIGQIDFLPGDLLLFYTDGLSEAKNIEGDFYTEERLFGQVASKWPSAFSLVKHLELDVNSHMGEQVQFDDITLLALRRSGLKQELFHKFTQKAELAYLPQFRDFVQEVCRLLALETLQAESLVLAVDEVCSNVILHGYKGLLAGEILVSVFQRENEILVQIEDSGHPFDPSKIEAPNLGDDIDKRKIGGLGVFLVNEMVDDMFYKNEDGKNCMSLKVIQHK
ncbi:MAG: SpoIIE family protein phosphatase [Bacteroides sp.]|nr:SpoIIE family protein phosphatase [Bacteroides sp.]